jgi:hypothetical protein
MKRIRAMLLYATYIDTVASIRVALASQAGQILLAKYNCFLGVKGVKYGWTIAHDECRNNLGPGRA